MVNKYYQDSEKKHVKDIKIFLRKKKIKGQKGQGQIPKSS